MKILGRFLWRIHVVEIYQDGDGIGVIVNKWHPMSWFFFLYSIIFYMFFGGIEELKYQWKQDKLLFGYPEYWKTHKVKFIHRKENI